MHCPAAIFEIIHYSASGLREMVEEVCMHQVGLDKWYMQKTARW